MNLLVCISNVPDTTTKIRFNSEMTKFDTTGVQWVINPWDELALTRALELKEGSAALISRVSVVNVGKIDAEPTIRKALAMGADDGIRIDAEPMDSYTIAAQIAEAIKTENFDIILSGIESSDYNSSSVGSMLAEFLLIPSFSSVSSIEISGNEITLKREIEGGKETIIASPPFVAVVQKGICINPRIPSMKGIMSARTKPLKVIPQIDIMPLTEITVFEMPPAKSACKMIEAEDTDKLVELLRNEAKVI